MRIVVVCVLFLFSVCMAFDPAEVTAHLQGIVDSKSVLYNLSYSVSFMHESLSEPITVVAGINDHKTGSKITSNQLFPSGSVTKNLWAVTALRLQEKGVLDFDEKVVDVLDPWLAKHYNIP
eukprot:UN20367